MSIDEDVPLKGKSYGLVAPRYVTFAEPPDELPLECGRKLGPVTLCYETYGRLNEARDNAVLVVHALTGDAHVAGYHTPDDRKPGWWDVMVGPEKPIDTDRYFVICANLIGGCKGSTGPSTINAATGRPYATDFPVVTVSDMVRTQAILADHLGIDRLLTVIGGSLGGMQVLEWALAYPERVASIIPVAAAARLSVQGIAFDEVGRQAIMTDPAWNGGNYYDDVGGGPVQGMRLAAEVASLPNVVAAGTGVGTDSAAPPPQAAWPPINGLAVARMIGHITYLSEESMREKFGRRLQDKEGLEYDFSSEFEVESYLRYQGDAFIKRFDANSYLYITKAMDYYDAAARWGGGSLIRAFERIDPRTRVLVVSFTSDWLFPTAQSKEIIRALKANGIPTASIEVPSGYGHDAFLLPNDQLEETIGGFLAAVHRDVASGKAGGGRALP